MIHFFYLRKSECCGPLTAFPAQCCDLGFDLCTHEQNTQGRQRLCSEPQSLSSPCKVHPVHVGYRLTILQRGVHFIDTCCLDNTLQVAVAPASKTFCRKSRYLLKCFRRRNPLKCSSAPSKSWRSKRPPYFIFL